MAGLFGGISTSKIASGLMSWLMTAGFWMLLVAVIVIVAWLALWMRKRRMLDKGVLELVDKGTILFDNNGVPDWSKSSGIFDFYYEPKGGGWFKNRTTLMGLWDYGNEKQFKLKDGTPVYDVSHNDYRTFNGNPCIVIVRCPSDPKFVVPISKFYLSKHAKEAMAEIAPVDLRNAASNSLEQVDLEMQKKWEKWAPLLTVGLVALVLIFGILLITQYGKHNIETTTTLLKYVADKVYGPGTAAAQAFISGAP